MRLVLLFLLAPMLALSQSATIAVAPFSVPSDVQYRYDFNGTGLSESIPVLMEAALFETGKFAIVERARLDILMDEQALSYAGITEDQFDFGAMKGVDYFLIGKISGYSAEVDNVRVQVGIKTMYVNNQSVKITLTTRLVSVKTGQLVAVVTETADVMRKGRPRGNQSNQLDHSLIDDAAREVVQKIASSIAEKYLKLAVVQE